MRQTILLPFCSSLKPLFMKQWCNDKVALIDAMGVAYESPPARNPSGTGEMAGSAEPASPPEGSAGGTSPRGSGINPSPMVGEVYDEDGGGEV